MRPVSGAPEALEVFQVWSHEALSKCVHTMLLHGLVEVIGVTPPLPLPFRG